MVGCADTMSEVMSAGVRISYEVVGQGRPLMLLHGWCCDRSWWTEPGYVDELRRDHRERRGDRRELHGDKRELRRDVNDSKASN